MALVTRSFHVLPNLDQSWDTRYPNGDKSQVQPATLGIDLASFNTAAYNLFARIGTGALSFNYRTFLTGTSAATATLTVNATSGSTLGNWTIDATGNLLTNPNTAVGSGSLQVVASDNAGNSQSFPIQSWGLISSAQTIKWNPGFWTEGNTALYRGDQVSRIQFELNLVLSSPVYVNGYMVLATWAHVDLGGGTFNFTALDATYNQLAAKGKRMVISMQVGAFSNTHPGGSDPSIIPLDVQTNVGTYSQAGYRVAGVTTQPGGASGWWGGDYQNSYGARLDKAAVNNRFIQCVQAIGAHFDSKPFFEGIFFQENSLWIGAVANNGGGSGYSDANALAQQKALLQAAIAAFPTSNVWFSNTWMQTQQPTMDMEVYICTNRVMPAQTDTLGATLQKNGILTSGWGPQTYRGQLGTTDYAARGVHLGCEVQAPDFGAYGATGKGRDLSDIIVNFNTIAKGSHLFVVVIPDGAAPAILPATRTWTPNLAAMQAALPLPAANLTYPSTYP